MPQATLPALRTEVRSMPLQTRSVPVTSVNETERTFEFVWTSGARVKRFDWATWSYYLEELSLDPAHVRLDRLKAGAPLLNSHQQWDLSSVLGVHEDAWLKSGEGRAVARFSDRDEVVNAYWRDVVNKIIRNISTGYIVHRYEKTDPDQEGGLPIWRAIDWEPCENSLVPIGADPFAGVRALGETGERPDAEELLAQASLAVGGRTFPCEFITRSGTPASEVSQPATAAAVDSNPPKEISMPNNTRGAAADPVAGANPAPAVPAPAAAPATGAETRSPEQILADERTRSAAIRSAVASFRRTAHGELVTEADVESMLSRGLTLDQARAEMFAKLESGSNASGPTRGAAGLQTTQDEQEQRRVDMGAAVAHRANPGTNQLPETARRFRGMTLFELARRSLELQGLNTDGMGRNEIVSVAMGNSDAMGFRSMHGTSDFSIALASTVNRTLRQAYQSAPQTFKAWARRGTLSDFRAATRVAVAGNLTLEKVNEFGEFKRGKLVDGGETIQLATYGKVVGVTRQAVINDDLDFLSRIPAMYGRAAADFESDTVYSILKANAAMSDSVALFHATHGNLGTAGVIGETTLNEARKAMRLQKDPSGNGSPLNLVAKYVIVGATRETEAQKNFQAVVIATKSADTNVFNNAYEIIVEPRLDASNPLEWFMAADPSQIDTVEYAYLDGDEGLYTEQRMGFDVDGLEVKARLDFATKAIDYRGLFKNPGV